MREQSEKEKELLRKQFEYLNNASREKKAKVEKEEKEKLEPYDYVTQLDLNIHTSKKHIFKQEDEKEACITDKDYITQIDFNTHQKPAQLTSQNPSEKTNPNPTLDKKQDTPRKTKKYTYTFEKKDKNVYKHYQSYSIKKEVSNPLRKNQKNKIPLYIVLFFIASLGAIAFLLQDYIFGIHENSKIKRTTVVIDKLISKHQYQKAREYLHVTEINSPTKETLKKRIEKFEMLYRNKKLGTKGWFKEKLPKGLYRDRNYGCYIWQKDQSTMVFVPKGFYIKTYRKKEKIYFSKAIISTNMN